MATGRSSRPFPDDFREFICSLCFEVFKCPKFLPCFHTFCLACLEQLVLRLESSNSFPCPICRSICCVPHGGVCNFQTNFYLANLDKLLGERFGQDLDKKDKVWESLHGKCAATKGAILKKYEAVVTVAEKFRDDSLSALERIYNQSIVKMHPIAVDTCKEQSSHGAAKEQSLTKRTIGYPFLNTKVRFEVVAETVKQFLGCVCGEETENAEQEVTTVEQFQLEMEADTAVWSLCPLNGGKYVWIAFSRFGFDIPCKKFDEAGGHRLTSETASGRCSFKSRGAGESFFAEESQSSRITFSKSERDQHIKLSNYCKGTASIKRVKVKSEDPFDTEEILECRIQVGPHCAFDADSSGQFYVVIEEVKNPDTQSMVRLYRRNQEDAVATYSSPIDNFQPSDVCFYQLGGKEVLIVADEGTSRLHVVEVGANKMDFKRFLDLACPLLVQPTALNTDTNGRLWVACRWGTILTMSPIV